MGKSAPNFSYQFLLPYARLEIRCKLANPMMNGAPQSPEDIDLYEILGVPKDASQADIRKAYRKQALANHPDKVPPEEREEAEARFKAASQAYEILYDDEKRHLYDAQGMAAFNGGGGGAGAEVNMEDILNMFGMDRLQPSKRKRLMKFRSRSLILMTLVVKKPITPGRMTRVLNKLNARPSKPIHTA